MTFYNGVTLKIRLVPLDVGVYRNLSKMNTVLYNYFCFQFDAVCNLHSVLLQFPVLKR